MGDSTTSFAEQTSVSITATPITTIAASHASAKAVTGFAKAAFSSPSIISKDSAACIAK